MTYPPENTKINELQIGVFSDVCDVLRPTWRDFANALEENRFQLKAIEIERLAMAVHQPGTWNCAEKLLQKLSERGMLVKHLNKYLRKLHLYAALQYLVPPEEVQILTFSDPLVRVDEGSKLTLMCQASAIPPPLYTWFLDQTVIHPASQDPKLTIPCASLRDAGPYHCSVSRVGHEAETVHWSPCIRVEVQHVVSFFSSPPPQPPIHAPPKVLQAVYAPRIVRQTGQGGGWARTEVTRDYGTGLQLECQAVGEPSPDFQWLKDDAILDGQTDPILQILKVAGYDSGVYQCCACNSQGEARSYKVKVQVMDGKVDKLVITLHPADMVMETGGKVVFTLKAEGRNLSYQWYKDGAQIPGSTERRYEIHDVNGDHQGEYQCRVAIHNDQRKMLKDSLSRPGRLAVQRRGDKPASADDKVALVIGVSPEKGSAARLLCVINDCILITRKLRELDFKVMSYYDLTKREIETAVEIFADFLGEGVYGVVYLAGHGLYCAGQHYFFPVDPHESSFLRDYYCCENMQDTLLARKPKLLAVFLDMCRTSFTGEDKDVQKAEEFKADDEKGNLIVFYATLPYRQALEPSVRDMDQQTELDMPLLHPESHGILCSLLSQVMHRNRLIGQMFCDVQDALLESKDWKTMEPNGFKPQIPTMQMNLLDWRVSLTDPLKHGHAHLSKWDRMSAVPRSSVINSNGLTIRVSFRELLSTVLEVTVTPCFTDGRPRSGHVCVTLDQTAMPQVLLMAQRVDHYPNKPSGSTAIISRLHKHIGELALKVKVEQMDKCSEVVKSETRMYDVLINYVLMNSMASNFVCADLEGRACHQGEAAGESSGGEGAKGQGARGGQEHDE